ncbi:DUF1127 domain-containing protein [Aestuariicoccus sp. MJ-SS9]|uniref:DUF1127 domain-containing protein n=1 Tax=Aestuariicoccus sp. MJ-SS9 TaxID=3079855 RepID=UPI00290B628D|nr:DUF1127 domain-containing protein [Aestuariicoccus sp. MJ-SS9]MDU8910265.1 DUF1127 domain-containing protein [Aestuariicoccus sp. MJ-SS9]
MSFVEITRHMPQPLDLARMLRTWAALARQRRALAKLDADTLRDVGITADEATIEAKRPVWDAPRNWYI